jgi:hypothetical protein
VQSPSGKVVLITGASAGIGKALAYEYARRRASVVITGRRLDRLKHLATELTADGYSVLPLLCDVRKDGDIEKALAATVAHYGKLEIVIANAGFGVVGVFAELSMDHYRAQFETNVFGVIRTAYAALPELRKTKGGLVIISSVSGYCLARDISVLHEQIRPASLCTVHSVRDGSGGNCRDQYLSWVRAVRNPPSGQSGGVASGHYRSDLHNGVMKWLSLPMGNYLSGFSATFLDFLVSPSVA